MRRSKKQLERMLFYLEIVIATHPDEKMRDGAGLQADAIRFCMGRSSPLDEIEMLLFSSDEKAHDGTEDL